MHTLSLVFTSHGSQKCFSNWQCDEIPSLTALHPSSAVRVTIASKQDKIPIVVRAYTDCEVYIHAFIRFMIVLDSLERQNE